MALVGRKSSSQEIKLQIVHLFKPIIKHLSCITKDNINFSNNNTIQARKDASELTSQFVIDFMIKNKVKP